MAVECSIGGSHGRMYGFLLILGAVIAAAGLALIASGFSIQSHAFDPTNVTPGIIAVVGGCILIGLAFAVHALTRVERALMLRPMPRPIHAGESADALPPGTQASEAGHNPFPSNPKAAPQPQLSTADAERAGPAEVASEVRSSVRAEDTPLIQTSDVSLTTTGTSSQEERSEPRQAIPARTNGAAPAQGGAQIAVSGRPTRPPQQQAKISMFDALWPKTQRGAGESHAAPVAQPVSLPADPPRQPGDVGAAAPPAQSPVASQQSVAPPAAAVSILKSGVVEGMAYTLYSDGSIEATLPGGTLRFKSITELRNHIEQNG